MDVEVESNFQTSIFENEFPAMQIIDWIIEMSLNVIT